MDESSGIQPWRPPAGFENPVPEPGAWRRRARERLAGSGMPADGWGIDEDAWEAAEPSADSRTTVATLKSWGPFIVMMLVFWFGASAVIDRIKDEDARSTSNSNSFPADGRSQLPGERAALAYTPLPDQKERVNHGYTSDGQPAWTGTMWALVTPEDRSFLTLFEMKFDPPLEPQMLEGALGFFNSQVAEDTGEPVSYSPRKIDGRDGWVWRHVDDAGNRALYAWVVDKNFGHRLQCRAAANEPSVWKQCLEALDSVELSDPA